MATKVLVNGKFVTRPGVYATIQSGVKNPPQNLPYGNVLIIDDGIGAGFGGGAGINGELTNGGNAVYSFNTIQDFQAFVKGGELWNLAKPLFAPSGNNSGVSKLFYIRAATTAAAQFVFTLANGAFTIKTLDEGLNANGVLDGSDNLIKGWAIKLAAVGSQFQLNFYHGTFKGVDALNNVPYDNVVSANAQPQLSLQSPVFTAISDLITWFNSSPDFNAAFKLADGSTATGDAVANDLTSYPGFTLAVGGTESYGTGDFDSALASVNNLDFTFFLGTKYGSNATSLNNTKIFDFISPDGGSKYERFLVVAGGFDRTAFISGEGSSAATAAYFNSDRVIVVHGGVKKVSRGISGFNTYSQLYKAAALLGRLCGLEPQTPLSIKTIGLDGEVHLLSDAEQEAALGLGILYTYYDYELSSFVVGQDINSLQNNQYLVNDDGTSFNIAIKRIEAYLNKSIVIAAKQRFFGGNTGPNRNTVSAEDVKAWLETFLLTKTASSLQDNLILGAQNIIVTTQQDNLFASYQFYPNSEISKLIFSGILLGQ